MSTFFWTCLAKVCLALLSLRYKVEIRGREQLTREKLNRKGGILFLPNHPALMDPLLLFLILWPRFRMRPVVVEYIYRTAILRPWMKIVKALAIPNFDTSVNELKVKKAEAMFQHIVHDLKNGENFIIYPSGKLKKGSKEVLGGASGVQTLLRDCPETNVVLIRTTGLWGSSFSRVVDGRSPDLKKILIHGMKTVLKNFIFFIPRRHILIEIESNSIQLPTEDRLDFNRTLENWYNRYPDKAGKSISEKEPLQLISYCFWRKELLQIQDKRRRERGGAADIPSDVRSKIYSEIRHIIGRPEIEIKPSMHLALDLGMDSLNIAELMAFVHKNFDVGRDLHPEDFETVQDTLEVAIGVRSKDESSEITQKFNWPPDTKRLSPLIPEGNTIQEAFLHSCQRMGSAAACGDDLIGVVSYKKLKRAALVLAERFRKIEDLHVGVLLPASVGAYIIILALQLAKKVPVMLNWTLGPRYLDEMMLQSGAKIAISSWRFLDRVSHIEFGARLNKIELLEDIRSSLSLKEKLRGMLLSSCSTSRIIRALKLDQVKPEDPAVILFTSGTETSPKGVPLSHKNILTNQRAAMQCIDVRSSDALYGILPPFHSFGFSVVGLFPILIGVKVAFYPDPTDSFALAEGIERWKITLMCSAPSFLKGLFHAAKPHQLKSMRYFVLGAEKSPPELYEKIASLGNQVSGLEGYGITECSPIISIRDPRVGAKGVGRLLPDIEICTIHPETQELLKQGEEGEICVHGPNVFSGYLGKARPAFIELKGKQWYRTGDLGYLDPEGNLILSGRLKRFTKFGGEMISLGAIEEVLLKALAEQGQQSPDAPALAVCADERDGQSKLIVFTIFSLEVDQANEILQKAGFSRLAKIADVRHVEEIPLLGTGKIDYRTLQTKITE